MYLAIDWMLVNDEVMVNCVCEHTGCSIQHFAICCWEPIHNAIPQDLHPEECHEFYKSLQSENQAILHLITNGG